MKISKLIISFFIFIALLTDAHGIEGDKYSESQRIHDIKSQIASLQQELYEFEQPLNLQQDLNKMNMHLSVSQTVDMDENCMDDWMDDGCKKLVCCSCTALTITALACMTFGYYMIC